MTRTDYRAARRLLRDNGAYSFRWMTPEANDLMMRLFWRAPVDPLAHRAWVAREFGPAGIAAEIRRTHGRFALT